MLVSLKPLCKSKLHWQRTQPLLSRPQPCCAFLVFLQYDDEEGDKVVISVDDDLAAAVKFARACNLKVREHKRALLEHMHRWSTCTVAASLPGVHKSS